MSAANMDYKPAGGVARAVLYSPQGDMEIDFGEERCSAVFDCEGADVVLLDDRSSFEEVAASDAGAVSVVHWSPRETMPRSGLLRTLCCVPRTRG